MQCKSFSHSFNNQKPVYFITKTSPCNEDPLTPHFYIVNWGLQGYTFLAHLSRRLVGELIGYPWSGVHPSSFTMLKDLLLRNRFANQSQILCGASLVRGNNILFGASGSHDQDGRHAHISYGKNPSKIFSRTSGPIFKKLGM